MLSNHESWVVCLFCRIVEATEDHLFLYPATVHYDGNITWLMPKIYVSSCLLDLDLFPWDHQTCRLKLASWSMPGDRMDIVNLTRTADVRNYYSSGEWQLMSADVSRVVSHYDCCQTAYPSLVYELQLRRKQTYYLANMVLPMSCVLVISVLIFLVPPQSGEKVSLSVTLLLSSTVFLLVVQDMLPVQSDSIPQLGK